MPRKHITPEQREAMQATKRAVADMVQRLTEQLRRGAGIACVCGFTPRTTLKGVVRAEDVERFSHRDSRGQPCLGSWWDARKVCA